MSNKGERPKVDWSGRRLCDIFTDLDGSLWQLQVDYNTNKVIPVKIQEAPNPVRLHTSHCGKPNVRQKF